MSDSTNSLSDSIASPQLDQGLLDGLTGAVLRKINIAKLASSCGRAESASIEEVTFDNTSVDQVDIADLSMNVLCGSALLRNVRLILEMHYNVDWSYDLKWLGTDSGSKALGSNAKPIPLHDIRIPVLQDISLNIPQAEVDDITASIDPVTGIGLNGISFEGLSVNNTNLPSDGFSISGMGFKSFELDKFGVPAADSEDVKIDRFALDQPIKLPDISVSGINVPAVTIDDVVSDGAVSIMDIQVEEFEAPVFKISDFFKAYFKVTPVLHLQIGELVLSDLQASASVGSVTVKGASTDVAASGIKLEKLSLNELTVNDVKI